MQVDIVTLAVTTTITGVVGWGVKALLDTLRAYVESSQAWRAGMDKKMDVLTNATQTTMRTELLHLSEKYLTRGWITPEERKAIFDMHEKYAALDANGYIDRYMRRVDALPDREI